MPGEDFDINSAVDSIGGDLFGSGGTLEKREVSGSGDVSLGGGDPSSEAGVSGGESTPTLTAEAPATTAPAETPASPASSEIVPPPKTWRAGALAHWDKLPPEVQAEVVKREEDIMKGLDSYKSAASRGTAFDRVIAPFQDTLRQYNIDPVQRAGQLFQIDKVLALGTPAEKTEMLARIAQGYGIQLPGTGESTSNIDPAVAELRAELGSLKSSLNQQTQAAQNAERERLGKEIDAFAADKANVYFQAVVPKMVDLLEKGAATSLQDAYQQAIWLTPEARDKEVARLQAEKTALAEKAAAEKAAAARKAVAANVKSRQKASSATAPLGSLDETLAATLASIRSRAN